MRTGLRIVLSVASNLVLWNGACWGEPPMGTDPNSPVSRWYRGLQAPSGIPCCSIADCRNVTYRMMDKHYEAFIDKRSFGDEAPNDWVKVPDERVLHMPDNPTNDAVACYYSGDILCFVEGPGT